jgi:hypothetical protein
MDPKKRNDNKWSSMSPSDRVVALMRLRDVPHKLKSPDRLYNQDWFIGEILNEGLEQAYMDTITQNNRK